MHRCDARLDGRAHLRSPRLDRAAVRPLEPGESSLLGVALVEQLRGGTPRGNTKCGRARAVRQNARGGWCELTLVYRGYCSSKRRRIRT